MTSNSALLTDAYSSPRRAQVGPAKRERWGLNLGKPNYRYVAKSESTKGWRVWDRKLKRWWGEWRREYPETVLKELNGEKRPQILVELCRKK